MRNLLAKNNFYHDYTVGVPLAGWYKRVFSTYDSLPGSGATDVPPLSATEGECDRYPYRLTYSLRPFESLIIELPNA